MLGKRKYCSTSLPDRSSIFIRPFSKHYSNKDRIKINQPFSSYEKETKSEKIYILLFVATINPITKNDLKNEQVLIFIASGRINLGHLASD